MADQEELTEQEQAAAAEEVERQAAIAMGDIIVTDEDAEPDVPAPAAEPPAKKDDLIPKGRFNELNEENKALKEKIAAMEAATAAVPDDVTYSQAEAHRDALQDKADEMLIEGDLEGRRAILKEIRSIDRSLSRAEIQYEFSQKESVSTLNEVVAQAQREYAFLDPDSPAFDADAITILNARQQELIQAGQTPARALHNAIIEKGDKLAKMLGVEVNTTSRGDEVKAQRDKVARTKAAAASMSQPSGLPLQTDKDKFIVNAATMTAKQILALPEADRARAMGDVL